MLVNKCPLLSSAFIFVLVFACSSFLVRCEDGTIEPASNGTLVSISKCLYLYYRSFTLTDQTQKPISIGQPVKASGSCSADSIRSSSNVKIEFDLPPAQTYSKIVLDLSLTEPDQQSGFWSVDKATATLTTVAGVQTLTLKSEPIESLQNFSYSCNRQLFTSDINGEPITLEFERFQLQGFEGDVFNESFDCASWFTLGMWMSLLFILLFVTIVTLGVCFIVSVQTNDRFEDPRGKPLYVPNTD